MWLHVLWVFSLPDAVVTVKRTFEPLPEKSGFFLQYPADFTFGRDGRFYLLDAMSQKIFVWTTEGKFESQFGRAGNGPGEFSFTDRGKLRGFITVISDKVVVLQGERRLIQYFSQDGQYLDSRYFEQLSGRPRYFRATPDGNFFVLGQNYRTEVPKLSLVLYSNELVPLKTLFEQDDKFFIPRNINGQTVGWHIYAFTPEPALYAGPFTPFFLVGHNEKPQFEMLDLQGNAIRTVSLNLTRSEVTPEDMAEYRSLPWLRGNHSHEVHFPKYKPYYQNILPIGDLGFLVFTQTPVKKTVRGVIVTESGQELGRFHFECGEDGGIEGVDGRILAIRTDEEGNFHIEELQIDLISNRQY